MTRALRTAFVAVSALSIGVAFGDASTTIELPFRRATNLKVLPRDIPAARLKRVMNGFERDLGVRCSHCHAEDPDAQSLDYASDENPRKQTARVMLAMLDEINGKYLAQLGGDRRYAEPVTCGSCHQGQGTPPAFERGNDE